jgi:hypothetical protein
MYSVEQCWRTVLQHCTRGTRLPLYVLNQPSPDPADSNCGIALPRRHHILFHHSLFPASARVVASSPPGAGQSSPPLASALAHFPKFPQPAPPSNPASSSPHPPLHTHWADRSPTSKFFSSRRKIPHPARSSPSAQQRTVGKGIVAGEQCQTTMRQARLRFLVHVSL